MAIDLPRRYSSYILVRGVVVAFVCTGALAQQPRITAVSPSQGPTAAVTLVTLKGTNLAGTSVTLDGAPLTPISQNDTSIQLLMPEHANGYAVISAGSDTGRAYGKFLYVPPKLAGLPAGSITTIAGVGLFNNLYGPATEALIHATNGFMFQGGKTYVADANANRVYVVQPDGTIEPFAGNGIGTFGSPLGDGGPALDASISFPHNVAFDEGGNTYIPDARYFIRRVRPDGTIDTIAGTGQQGFSGDGGPAILARIGYPSWIAADREDVFFIDDDVRIRRIHLADGKISTFAGDGNAGFAGDGGPATQARWSIPGTDDGGLTLDSAGNVYLLDTDNGRIRRIDRRTGIIDTAVVVRDSQGQTSKITAMTVGPDGSLYFSGGSYIAKADKDGHVVAEWGDRSGRRQGYSEDGTPVAAALFSQINYLTIDPNGNIGFADSAVNTSRRINLTTGVLETIAGVGPRCFNENGAAIGSVLNMEDDVEITPAGELLVADNWSSRIRKLDASGNFTTIAGNGMTAGPQDGMPATSTGMVALAMHADANGIDVVPFGKLARIDAAGIAHVVTRFLAGPEGICRYSGDGGPAIDAGLCQPWDTARDGDGNLFVADTNNNRIRRIDGKTGFITTVAGNGGPRNGFEGYGRGVECGDGGPAIDACLNTPYGVVFDPDGNLFVSDSNKTIRKIDPHGTISTVATFAATKLRSDAAGSLFGFGRSRVVRFDRSGMTTTLAGGDQGGFSGDGGPAASARLGTFDGQASGVAIDRGGNLFFFDGGNWRVRAIRYGAVLAPPNATIQASATGSTIRATVFHSNGRPAPSVRVDFSAPSSGPSCHLSNAFAVTDAHGVATVSCNSNCIPGTFVVNAQPLTAASLASVSFTNSSGPCRRRAVFH